MAKAQLEIVLTDAGGSAPTESDMERRAPVVTPAAATTTQPAPQSAQPSAPGTGDTQPITAADTQVVTPSPATRTADRQPETTGQAAWMAAKEIAAETSMGRLVATIDRLWTKLQRAADMLNPQRLTVPERQVQPAAVETPEPLREPSDTSATVEDIPPVQPTEADSDTGAITTAATGAAGRAATQAATAAETGATTAATGAAASGTAATGASAAGAAAATGLMAAGVAAGAVVAGFGLAAMASKALSNALEAQASTMAAYSASVADATAATELAQEAANMRRADALGPELAEFERERSDIEATMADAMTSIYKVMLVFWNIFEPVIFVIAKAVEVSAKLLESVVSLLTAIFQFLTLQWPAMLGNFEKATKAFKDAMTPKNNDEDPLDNSFANQFKGLGQAMADRERPGKRKAKGGGGMGDPLFIPDPNRR